MEEKSRSQAKREVEALQKMGERLCKAPNDILERIPLSVELREALHFARSLKGREARRRHMQFIGSLMREVDPEPIRNALAGTDQEHRKEILRFQMLEKTRDTLIEGNEEAILEIIEKFPDANPQQLRQLVRNARKEKAKGEASRSSRALFQYLRELCRTTPEQRSGVE
jgi:ribosome-associated protein